MGTGTRPLGITILSILQLLGGIICLLGGIGIAVGGSALLSTLSGTGITGSILGALAGLLGGVLVIAGIIALLIGYGFWKGTKWSWWMAMVLYILGILFSIVSIVTGGFSSIVSLIIDAVIIYYITRPQVKKWFGM